MSSDQKFSTLTADGNFKTITGGSTNIGPCRVTYIQAHGGTNCLVKLHDEQEQVVLYNFKLSLVVKVQISMFQEMVLDLKQEYIQI